MMESESEYEKQERAMKKKMKGLAEKTDSKVLKSHAKGESPEVKKNCQMIHMLADEAVKMYESGMMTLKETVDDLHRALLAVADEKEEQ